MGACDRDRSSLLEAAFIDLAVESWRLHRLSAGVVMRLDVGERKRYGSRLRYFRKRLDHAMEKAGLELVNLEGNRFEPGMAVSPLNLADFEPDDDLVVDRMVEPIIMGAEGLKKEGTVLLRKADG